MDLMESLNETQNVRGITLNSQQIDLLNLVKNENATDEIYSYLTDVLLASKLNSKGMSTSEKINKVISEKANVTDKKKFKSFILKNAMQIRANWDSKEKLQELFSGQEIEDSYIDEILNIKKYFAYQTHGILTFLVDKDGKSLDTNEDYDTLIQKIDKEKTMQKVKALYEYVTGDIKQERKKAKKI